MQKLSASNMAISTRLSIILKAVLFLTVGVSVISCERIRNKKHQAISKAKEKLRSGRDKMENKVLPIFRHALWDLVEDDREVMIHHENVSSWSLWLN